MVQLGSAKLCVQFSLDKPCNHQADSPVHVYCLITLGFLTSFVIQPFCHSPNVLYHLKGTVIVVNHTVQGVPCPRGLGFVDLDLGCSTILLRQ